VGQFHWHQYSTKRLDPHPDLMQTLCKDRTDRQKVLVRFKTSPQYEGISFLVAIFEASLTSLYRNPIISKVCIRSVSKATSLWNSFHRYRQLYVGTKEYVSGCIISIENAMFFPWEKNKIKINKTNLQCSFVHRKSSSSLCIISQIQFDPTRDILKGE